jgi:hemolysin activation/secretion protein
MKLIRGLTVNFMMSSFSFRTIFWGGLVLLLTVPAQAQQVTSQEGEWTEFRPATKNDISKPLTASEFEPPLLVGKIDFSRDTEAVFETQRSSVRVGSVLVQTTATIDHAMFEKAIEPFLGQELDSDELAKLVQQITEIARSNGMILADAHIPPQKVELGIVKIVLNVGSIDEIRIEGSANKALKSLLDPLVGQTTVRGELERRLMLANNIPQIIVRKTELIKEEGRQILLVSVEEKPKAKGRLVLDNFGSQRIGPIRARLKVEAVALLDDSDYLDATFRSNPVDPGEMVAASSVYGIGIGNNGTRAEIAVAWSKSNIDPRNGFDRRGGRSRYASLSLSHPVVRSRTANLWLEGQFEYLKIDQKSLGALLQSDTVVTMNAGLSASKRLGAGWLRSGAQIRQGFGILGASGEARPYSSRFDADGRFTSAKAWVNWAGKVADDLTLRVAVSGQLASEPLLSAEEIGLGGSYSGRAFEYYEKSGDQGVAAFVEIGHEISQPLNWIDRLQPYVFLDGGYVDNLNGGFGGGTLVSSGGGIRAEIGKLDLQFETALPLHQSSMGGVQSSPQFNVQVGMEF